MSQHSQRTQDGPTTRSIVIGALMVAGSMTGTLYVIGGPGINGRELVASLMGAALIGFTVAHTMSLMVERAVVRDRAERAAEREQRERTERESGHLRELEAWQNAAAGLLDAYLTGRAVNFGGEPVPDYVRTRLADLAPPPVSQPEPPVDEGPVVYPPQPDVDQARTWLADPEVAARYAEPVYEDPLGYQADPERPWRVFEPRHEDRMAEPGEPDQVAVPLPPREVPVSPGRGWHGDETEVISRVRDGDQTQVIPAQS